MRGEHFLYCMLAFGGAFAQDPIQLTLYNEHTGRAWQVQEGGHMTMLIRSTRCSGWEEQFHSVSGSLLAVDDSTVTLSLDSQFVHCSAADSSMIWNFTSHDENATFTIDKARIECVLRVRPLGRVFCWVGLAGLGLGLTAAVLQPHEDTSEGTARDLGPLAWSGFVTFAVCLPLSFVLGGEQRMLLSPPAPSSLP